MKERQRRARAATQLLRDRFPQFASMRIDFEFSDASPFAPAPQVTVLHPPARTYFFFPCPYADCDGEFDLSDAVARLAQSGDAHVAGQLKCCGQRSTAGGRLSPCHLELEFSVTAQSV